MINNQAIALCCPLGQMSTLKRNRTSILRSNELIEIQGSYWPRILILSESAERQNKKTGGKKIEVSKAASAIKVSRRLKKKEMIRQLRKLSPFLSSAHSSVQRPISPCTFESSSSSSSCPNNALLSSISTIDQNTSPCSWKPCTLQQSKTKTSSFTGRPFMTQQDDASKFVFGQSYSGLKGPLRRKPLKAVVALR